MLEFDEKNLPPNFCSLPWLQIHTEPNGFVNPCCNYDINSYLGNWNDSTIEQIYNNKKWNSLRKQFIKNERPTECRKCWNDEDAGVTSARQIFNKMYSKDWQSRETENGKLHKLIAHSNMDGTINKELPLATVDLIFNNLCNFKCRSCSAKFSTSWGPDENKLYNNVNIGFLDNSKILHLNEDINYLISRIDSGSEIHFTGGEPMMQEEHYKFLKALIQAKKTHVRIRYNTNLSIHSLNGVDAFDLLKHFPNTIIIGSIDAMGTAGEYIRSGFDWETALEWLDDAIAQLPNAKFGISTVFQILNCFEAIELHKFIIGQQKYNNFGLYVNLLHGPEFLNTMCLPQEIKADVTAQIEELIKLINSASHRGASLNNTTIENWKNAINFMNSKNKSDNLKHFFKEIRLLDHIRNESFELTFPTLYDRLKNYDG